MRALQSLSPTIFQLKFKPTMYSCSYHNAYTIMLVQIGNVALAGKQLPLSISILAVALTTNPAKGLVPHFNPNTKAWLCCCAR
jgi:hypothetical protein